MTCTKCKNVFQVIVEPRCKKCGKPIEQEEQEFCFDCTQREFCYTSGMALWVYDRNVRKSISNFKYHNRKEYSNYYIQEMLAHYRERIIQLEAQVLIPVPLHNSKYRQRGFNQAYVLAKGLADGVGIPVIEQYLLRIRRTKAQKQLNDKDRTRNLSEAFEMNPKYIATKFNRVMLVDDIYTTGSTIDACAKVLKDEGVQDVYFISLSIGKGF